MFNGISWIDYLMVVVLLLISYYLFVGVKFYTYELRSLFQGKSHLGTSFGNDSLNEQITNSKHVQDNKSELFPSSERYAPQVQEADNTFQQVEELTTKLKEIIAKAVDNNYIKEEFVLSLQLLLRQYHFLKGSPFLVAVNNLLASECEKYGYIQLSAEERVMLWNE